MSICTQHTPYSSETGVYCFFTTRIINNASSASSTKLGYNNMAITNYKYER